MTAQGWKGTIWSPESPTVKFKVWVVGSPQRLVPSTERLLRGLTDSRGESYPFWVCSLFWLYFLSPLGALKTTGTDILLVTGPHYLIVPFIARAPDLQSCCFQNAGSSACNLFLSCSIFSVYKFLFKRSIFYGASPDS